MTRNNQARLYCLRKKPVHKPGRIRRWLKIAAIVVAVFSLVILKLRHDYPMPAAKPPAAHISNTCLRGMT